MDVVPKPKPMADTVADSLLRAALSRGQSVRLRASSNSMLPTIHPGDLLLVRRAPIRIGDIAVYWRMNDWVTHRVVAIDGDRLEVAGDATPGAREQIELREVVGSVVSVRHDWLSRRRALGRLLRRIFWSGK